MPLPWDVGEALAAYLSQARSATPLRQVFLAAKAPMRAIPPGLVSGVTRRACDRAGLPPHRRPPAAAHSRDAVHAGVDTAVIALWLGHADIRSTNAYLHADMAIKQRALDLTTPTSTPPGRYCPADPLLAFLESL
jgi:integrase